jgi:FMN phosphatase YigB (HAD superfamily)
MIKAVIFDCFGVIRPDSFIPAYRALGGDPVADKDFIDDTVKAAHRGMISDLPQVIAARLNISVERWLHALDHGNGVDRELLEYVAELHKTYKTAVLSNVSKGRLTEIIGQQDAERCFDILVESGALGFAKPEPEIYEYTADKLGVRFDECVFTDDRQEYCDAARAVGMQAIAYESFPQFKIQLQALLQ